jgi:chromosome segregation ATPase
MIRDLMLLPGVPRRMLDDIGEIKELIRELLETEHELTRTSKDMASKLDAANTRLDRTLEEVRSFNQKMGRLDRRVEHIERELTVVRAGMEEVTEAVPELGKGPLEKAKDALSGGER